MIKAKTEKRLIGILLSLISILIVNSCCTKVHCIGADDLNDISFYGFNQQDLDTLVIKRYNKDSNFQNYLDSLFIEPEYFTSSTEYEMVHLTDKLIVDYDYKIEIISTRQTFTITDFIVEKEKCNTGFMCFDYYNSLGSYKVNGETQTYGFLRIDN